MISLGVNSFGISLCRVHASYISMFMSFSKFGTFLAIISLNIFLIPYFSSFCNSSGTNVVSFIIVLEVP